MSGDRMDSSDIRTFSCFIEIVELDIFLKRSLYGKK